MATRRSDAPPAGGDDDPAAVPTLDGPAYPLPVKTIATLALLALAVAGARMAVERGVAAWTPAAQASLTVVAIGVIVCWGAVMVSRTSIDATHITQKWLWPKHVRLADITQARLIHLPGLSWIVAPRLVVRASDRRQAIVFPAADDEVLRAFARIAEGRPPR